jgi:hypothetical protein
MSDGNENLRLGEANDRLKQVALRMARRCRGIVQGCLREEEWLDCDEEFFAVILEELLQL